MKTNSLADAATRMTGTKPAGTTAVAKTERKVLPPSQVVGNMLSHYKDAIQQALPSVMTPERFTRIATTTIANNPKLMQAVQESPRTLVAALMTCAQLGLEPNTPLGQCYILPYLNTNKNTGQKEMQVNLQLGYQGVLDLARRSGDISMVYAKTVYERDEYEVEWGLNPVLKHKPYRGADHGRAVAYYAVFHTKTGDGKQFDWMWREEVLEHAKRFSKSYNSEKGRFFGPWDTDFDAMAQKTVLLRLLKYAPKKSEFAKAIMTDSTTKSVIAKDMLSVPNEDFSVSDPFADEKEPQKAPDASDEKGDAGAAKKPAAAQKPSGATQEELDIGSREEEVAADIEAIM